MKPRSPLGCGAFAWDENADCRDLVVRGKTMMAVPGRRRMILLAPAASNADAAEQPVAEYGGRVHRAVEPIGRELLAAAAAVVVLGLLLMVMAHAGWRPPSVWGYFWVGVAGIGVVVAGRRYPLPVLGAVGALLVLMTIFQIDTTRIAPLIFLIAPLYLSAFFAIAVGARPRITIALFAAVSVITVIPFMSIASLVATSHGEGSLAEILGLFDWSNITLLLAGSVLTSILGWTVRRQRIAVDLLQKRTIELEELRALEAQRVVEHTRSMLARDIHDDVAHHVAALVIASNAGLRLSDEQPERLPALMKDLAHGAKETLGKLRTIVRVLQVGAGEFDPTSQTEVAAGIAEIAERVGRAGLTVEYEISGDDTLSAEQRTALLLIAQEALTNVLLHSASRRAQLNLTVESHQVTLTIDDAGPAEERFIDLPLGGTGLTSMSDRARALGGTVVARSAGSEGWTVLVHLPRVSVAAQ